MKKKELTLEDIKDIKRSFKIAVVLLIIGICMTSFVRWYLLNMIPTDVAGVQETIDGMLPIADAIFFVFVGLGVVTIYFYGMLWLGIKYNKNPDGVV